MRADDVVADEIAEDAAAPYRPFPSARQTPRHLTQERVKARSADEAMALKIVPACVYPTVAGYLLMAGKLLRAWNAGAVGRFESQNRGENPGMRDLSFTPGLSLPRTSHLRLWDLPERPPPPRPSTTLEYDADFLAWEAAGRLFDGID